MTHPTRAFSGSIINRFTGSKILARVGQISVAFPETAVTTCGVTIFEISQMAPITIESRIVSSMKRVQPKWRTCLGEVGYCLILSVLFEASALMKAGV